MLEVYNLLNGEMTKCYSLKEAFAIVMREREVLVHDLQNGHKAHFKNGEKIGQNWDD